MFKFLVPGLLAVQALLVYSVSSAERPPALPQLSRFPAEIGGWKQFREDILDPEVVTQLKADELLSRSYTESSTGTVAGLFIAWFQSQRGGKSQPHSPQVCLPASGWTPQSTGEMTIDTSAGPIVVNRYIVVNHAERAVVLYWYQTPRRVVAGELQAKLWLIADAFRDHRTDTALVRVVVWSTEGHDDSATSAAASFARTLYPMLREQLPH